MDLVAFGAVVRALLGIYKAYNTYPDFRPEWKRIFLEVVASTVFGSFALYFLQGLGIFAFGLNLAAPIAGLFGADAINLITKRLGLSKGLQVTVSKQQMQYADLNDREVRALDYIRKFGRITNKIYQKLNQVGRDIAKYELAALVKKGKSVKLGSGKQIFYTIPGSNDAGEMRVISGLSEKPTQKIHQKSPGQKPASLNVVLGTRKRSLRYAPATRQKFMQKNSPTNHPTVPSEKKVG